MDWADLTDEELRARLLQRGYNPALVDSVVENRDKYPLIVSELLE